MEFTNNLEEETNFKTFSSTEGQGIYKHYGLKGVERGVIRKYFVKPGAKLLDLGCGYGRTTKPLVEKKFDVIGIDIVPKMINIAKEDNPEIDYRLMSATKLEFPDNYFDYVLFSFNGIDFIYPEKRRIKALNEICRVLKPEGIAIIFSHNKMRLFTQIHFYNLKNILRNIFNLRIFSNYIISKHPEGDLVVYLKMPLGQKKDYEKANFEVLEISGKYYHNKILVNLFESWPYYVLKKRQ
ncbi:class I SAM-dependent methyltransferase [Patescibacteria group bacterium]